MNKKFDDLEKLFRAVYPPSHPGLFWKKDGRVSPAAFADPQGLSVEREAGRGSKEIIEKMRKQFTGYIISVNVKQCREVNAVVVYKPTKNNVFHSEIHGSESKALLSKSQRFHLAEVANNEYIENQ